MACMNRKQAGGILALALALVGAPPAEQRPADMVVLRPGVPLMRQLEAAGSDRLIVPLTTGWFVKIVVMQSGSDVVVTFRDSGGQVLVQSDSPLGAYGPETIATIATSSGNHELEVKLGNARKPKDRTK